MSEITNMFDELICKISGEMETPIKLNGNNKYKCLSVRQPWADLIVKGVKTIENRNWSTPHRGLLLIQAPLKFNHYDYNELEANGYWKDLMSIDEYPLGEIVGAVTLAGCLNPLYNKTMGWEDGKWADKTSKHWWKLSNPVKFMYPVRWKGQLNIFNVHDEEYEITNELARFT